MSACKHVGQAALLALVIGSGCGGGDDSAAPVSGAGGGQQGAAGGAPGGKADDPNGSGGSGESKSTDAGVNFSRYRAATAGCWVADPGYWNNSCPIISAADAVTALESTGISKVKLFAPGPYPKQEFDWFFPKWQEDLAALGKSATKPKLFVGIPNSSLFEIAGVPFEMMCGSEVFFEHTAASGSPACGSTKEERMRAVLAYMFETLEGKASAKPAISCHGAAGGTAFESTKEAFDSGQCTTEEITSALVEALLASDEFMADLSGPEKWLARYILDFVGADSALSVEYLGVGNEPFAPWHHDVFDALVLVSLKKTQSYLQKSNNPVLSSAKVTVPFAGTYASEPLLIEQVLRYLDNIDSVFMQNIYPHGDTFGSSLSYVKGQQKTLQPDLDLEEGEDPKTVMIAEKDLVFVKDFIAWGTGQPVSEANANTWNTRSFYEAYLAGYKNALSTQFSTAYDLPIYAGETGWPTHNARTYYDVDGEESARSLTFDDLKFEDHNGLSVATVPYLKFKQMVSNELFSERAA
ncbi:MAG: hypothetical protein MUF54_12665 [Polyangiaceae bacterium]|nr:hypothetical protein [Polyangiaceae bacterium]